MSATVSITNAELDVLYDLMDGDSVNSPEDARYEILMGFILKASAQDSRAPESFDSALKRHERAIGLDRESLNTSKEES